MLYYTFSFYKKMFSSSRSKEHDNEDYEHFSKHSSELLTLIENILTYLNAIYVLLAFYYKEMF